MYSLSARTPRSVSQVELKALKFTTLVALDTPSFTTYALMYAELALSRTVNGSVYFTKSLLFSPYA